MTPQHGDAFLSQQLLSHCLRPVKGFLELTQCPSRALNLDAYIASGMSEIQGHSHVWRARSGGPKTPSRTADASVC